MKECLKMLNANKYMLTKQQYRTLRGQILAGDKDGFKKGLCTIRNSK